MFAGSTGPARLETISKKFVEFMSVMEEFLYTRELSIKEYLPLLPQPSSKKKNVDQEIFNKFSHISNEVDRRIILESHRASSGLEGLEAKKKVKIYEQAKKLAVKSQDDCDLLEADPEKENYMSHYRRNIMHFASCGRRRPQMTVNSIGLTELTISQL
jgi:hypothetical protein